jgi:predicted anti-sigma-YlaC factor YlaD
MLSAQLDGEDEPGERELVEEHLAGCADCRAWLDRAATVNRLTRTGPATPVPDLSGSIMAALAARADDSELVPRSGAPRSMKRLIMRGGPVSAAAARLTRRRLATLLYLALAAVGAVQLILGLDQVGGGATGAHVHVGLDATPGHLWHESAAWNVAVGAGYLFIALRRNRPVGLVPMLTAFVGMLLLLSLGDLTAARVDSARLVSHGFVILGYLLVVALSKINLESARPPGARADDGEGSGWRAYFADENETEAALPVLRLVPRQSGPLSARREERPLSASRERRLSARREERRLSARREERRLSARREERPLSAGRERAQERPLSAGREERRAA